jgi:2-polyprenyl-3-methyl-5-hydroxy-6-metoxy-1,4-benzoquinol methylase
LGSQSEKWDKLSYVHDREREVACNAYLDLTAGRRTKNVESALKLKLGSPMLIEVPYILRLVGDVREKRVLDVGCGGGFYSLLLSERGAKVLGIDSSEQMIKTAMEKASRKMLDTKFSVGDVTALGIEDDVFDLVLSTLVLMDVKELDKAESELVRVTRNQGDIVVSVQHPILTAGDWAREAGQKLFRKLDDYFTEKELKAEWANEKKERVSLRYYHRSLQAYTQPFFERGCVLTALIEPNPHKVYKILNPTEYEDATRIPHFIILKYRKQTSIKGKD